MKFLIKKKELAFLVSVAFLLAFKYLIGLWLKMCPPQGVSCFTLTYVNFLSESTRPRAVALPSIPLLNSFKLRP